MMKADRAIYLFDCFLAKKQHELGDELVALSGSPKRLSRGWAFQYQSRAYVKTGEVGAMLIGHGPVVVSDDGRVIEGGSLVSDPEELLRS